MGNREAPLVGDSDEVSFTDLFILEGGSYVLRFCLGPCRDNEYQITKEILSDEFIVRHVDLTLVQEPDKAVSGKAFLVQPIVRVRNAHFDFQNKLYLTTEREYKWSITASVSKKGITLFGRRSVWPVDGLAYFTDLRLDRLLVGESFRLIFTSCHAETNCSADGGYVDDRMSLVVSEEMRVSPSHASQLTIVQQPKGTFAGTVLGSVCLKAKGAICLFSDLRYPPKVQVSDSFGNPVRTGSWFACARLISTTSASTDFEFLGDVQVKAVDGIATFTNLQVVLQGQYLINFTLFIGNDLVASNRVCQGQPTEIFSSVVSDVFAVDVSWASQIISVVNPFSEQEKKNSVQYINGIAIPGYRLNFFLDVELFQPSSPVFLQDVLSRQPVVRFADPFGNTMLLAHCASIKDCSMMVGVRIWNISEEDTRWPTDKVFSMCSSPPCLWLPDPKYPRRNTQDRDSLKVAPKDGIATFTDLVLIRMGWYTLQYFSGTLTALSSPFYVASSPPVVIEAFVSPR